MSQSSTRCTLIIHTKPPAKNSSESSRHELHKTSDGVLWYCNFVMWQGKRIVLLKEATAFRENRCHEGVYVVSNNI